LPSSIEQVSKDYRSRGLAVLAVNIQEEREHVVRWARSRKLTVPIVLDEDGAVTRAWQVTATPTVFLVGRDGKLVARGSGNRQWTGAQGRALLDAVVGR